MFSGGAQQHSNRINKYSNVQGKGERTIGDHVTPILKMFKDG